jgi:translation initiation factor 3 subunit B
LALKLERPTKSKKATVTSFEVYSTKNKEISNYVVQLEDTVHSWKWEPRGSRFGVIHSEEGASRMKVSFYQISSSVLLHKRTLENTPAKRLFWSPRGGMVIIAGNQGTMDFYNTQLDEIIGHSEHEKASDLVWDPTGRYVCTYISNLKNSVCNFFIFLFGFYTKV